MLNINIYLLNLFVRLYLNSQYGMDFIVIHRSCFVTCFVALSAGEACKFFYTFLYARIYMSASKDKAKRLNRLSSDFRPRSVLICR